MTLDPNSGSFITLDEARQYVCDYRKKYPDEIKGYFAGKTKLEEILDQTSCIGLRIYNGYSDVDKRTNLVIVGVNEGQKDMTSGLILEKLNPCPSDCDTTSSLY